MTAKSSIQDQGDKREVSGEEADKEIETKHKKGKEKENENENEKEKEKLYVGNLDPRVREYHILHLFRPFGVIVKEDFAWHTHGCKKGEPRGFCFIQYDSKEAAAQAKSKLQGKSLMGRPITIHFAEDHAPQTNAKADRANHHAVVPELDSKKKDATLSKEAMDAKIFAIKMKLKLMEKDEIPTKNTTLPNNRYKPYPSRH